jgi:hypothetical protein
MRPDYSLKRLVLVPIPTFQQTSVYASYGLLADLENTARKWSDAATNARKLLENDLYNLEPVLVPFTTVARLLKSVEEIQSQLKIVVLEGADDEHYTKIKTELWERFQILVVDAFMIENVKRNPEVIYEYHRTQVSDKSSSKKKRMNPESRYSELVGLMKENFSIIQIADHMHLSVPAIYQLRTRFRSELLRDVGNNVQGMRFTTKQTE